MARLPDETYVGVSHAGPLELPDAAGGAGAPARSEQAAAYNEAKADSDHLTRIQELRTKLDEETDPSRLAAYTADFQAANAARAATFSDPVRRQLWLQSSTLNAEGVIAAKASDLNGRNEIATTDERLKQIRSLALQGRGDETTRLIDAGSRLINGLLSAGYIDAATAQAKRRSWVEEYATEWLRRRRPEEQLAVLGDAPFGDNVVQGSGNAPADLTRGTGTPAELIPQEKRPGLLLAAKREVARNAEIRTTERFDLIGQFLDEASQGRIVLPERRVIEDEPDLSPSLKDALLRKHDVAAKNWRIFEVAQTNANNPDYVWNPRSEADKKGLSILDNWTGQVSGIASADPLQRSIAVKRFATIGMVSDDVKGTLEGMIRSGDMQKIEFAMSTLDNMQRVNPNGFRESFDQEATKTLMAWQERIYHPPGSFQTWLKRSSDPVMVKAREGAQARARQFSDKISDDDILAVHDTSWFSDPGKPMGSRDAPGMDIYRQHWTALFAEGYASFDGDAKLAKKFADDWIQQTWSASNANGGRLTMFAPEKTAAKLAFPSVNGSYDWMKQQVLDTLREKVGPPRVEIEGRYSPAELREKRIVEYNFPPKYWLVPDENTRSEIETLKAGRELPNDRKSPAWTLVYIDPKANYPKQVRFYFDVKAAEAERDKRRQEHLTKDLRNAENDKAHEPYSTVTWTGAP